MKDNSYAFTQELRLETTDYEEERTLQGRYEYEKDTYRFHRFRIITEAGIEGVIYIPRKMDPIPTRLILECALPESNKADEE